MIATRVTGAVSPKESRPIGLVSMGRRAVAIELQEVHGGRQLDRHSTVVRTFQLGR